jgi:hypothetical protein
LASGTSGLWLSGSYHLRFWEPAWYTMKEIDNRQLAVSLYVVPEKGTM